jgi:ribosomal protein L11 methylase PrmA
LFVVLDKIISDLAQVVIPGGMLILSGVLEEDSSVMIDRASSQGLTLQDHGQLEGWACLTFTKPRG